MEIADYVFFETIGLLLLLWTSVVVTEIHDRHKRTAEAVKKRLRQKEPSTFSTDMTREQEGWE